MSKPLHLDTSANATVKTLPESQRSQSSPLMSHGETHLGFRVLFWAPQAGRCLPELRGCKDHEGTGSSLVCRGAERAGTPLAGKEKA